VLPSADFSAHNPTCWCCPPWPIIGRLGRVAYRVFCDRSEAVVERLSRARPLRHQNSFASRPRAALADPGPSRCLRAEVLRSRSWLPWSSPGGAGPCVHHPPPVATTCCFWPSPSRAGVRRNCARHGILVRSIGPASP